MQKTHQSPEFTVIKQNQANAKFFVASFGTNDQTATQSQETSEVPGITNSSATSYGDGGDGFTF